MTGPVIGGVAVEVAPDARGWVPKFRAQVLPGASKVGDEYGRLFGDEASQQAVQAFQRGMGKANPRLDGTRQGDAFGTAFSTQIRKALDNLPKAKLDADASETERKLAEIRHQLSGLDSSIGVHLTDDTALRALNHLRLELDQLTLPEHDIRLRLNAGAASAELAAFEARIAGLSNSPSVPDGGGSSDNGPELSLPNLKVAAILGALPLVGPVASAAAGGMLQFAGAAGVAGLAVKGLSNEIQQETTLGLAVKAQTDQLTLSLTNMEHVAAVGASTGVLSGLKQVNDFLPSLNPLVASLAHHLGDAFSVATGGLLDGLRVVAPLLNDAGRYADILAGKLAAAARSPEFEHFVDYARQELPVIFDLLVHLGEAGVHLAEALTPVGTVIIAALDGVARVLSHIPTHVLTDLAVAATAVWVAFKGYTIIKAVNIALTEYAEEAILASGASAELAAANASATAGAGIMAAKFGALSGIGIGLGAVLIGAQSLSHALETVPATTEVVTRDLIEFTKTGEVTGQMMTDLGVKSKDLGSVMENAFHESTLTKIKDFGPGLDKLGIHVQNATRDMHNFFTSNDKALEQMVLTGNRLAADQAVQQWAAKSGVSVDQLLAHFPKYRQALDDIARSSAASGLAAEAASGAYQAAADKLGLTEQTAKSYAAMLGITADAVGKNKVSQDALNAAVEQVSHAYTDASQSGALYLSSLSQFAQSEGTASDRAALIGATLRAANGDALAFGGAMAEAAQADQALTTAFADQAAQAASNAEAVQAAQDALTVAHEQAARSLGNALDGVATAERAVTTAQQAALNAQKALTEARVAAKQAAEDLANQVIDGQLSERQAVLSLQSARAALGKPGGNQAQQQLAYDEAVQQLKEIRLQNQRLAAEKAASDRAGINGSSQVVSAQQNVAASTQAISDAQHNLVKSQQAVTDAQDQGARAILNAQRALTTAAANQAKALRASELAAIDAKTGLIDYTKQGAGPLVQQLQAMQDAAQKAAEATYQHEVATEGGTAAAIDAARVYDSLTRGALTSQYQQLGLTKDAAQHLADTYFSVPKNIDTTIAMIGGDPTQQTLDEIGQLLANLTHQPWVSHFGVAGLDEALAKVIAVQQRLANLADSVIYVQVNERTATGQFSSGRQVFQAEGAILDYYADGGLNNGLAKVQHFADGTEQHIAQIAPAGSYRTWAEAETGGEAYIPLAPSKRARSELILAEVARKFDLSVTRRSQRPDLGRMERLDRPTRGDITVQQIIQNPLPEPASVSGPKGLRRAAYALGN